MTKRCLKTAVLGGLVLALGLLLAGCPTPADNTGPSAAQTAADEFKSAQSAVFEKTVETVTPEDEAAVNDALEAYAALSPEAQALLTTEKALLDSLKEKIDELNGGPSAQELADLFKTTHAGILEKTPDTVAAGDEDAVNAALTAYETLTAGVKALLTAEKALLDDLKEKIDELNGDPPDAPENLQVQARADKLSVSWDPVSGASSYEVAYSTDNTVPAEGFITVTDETSTELGGLTEDPPLTGGADYYVWVRAKNGVGPGNWSNSASAKAKYAFDTLSDMADWLATATDNTAGTPYEVAFCYALLTDLKSGNDPLGGLFTALNGKYVALDLSGCTGDTLANASNYTSRPDKDKLVSVILPEELATIGDYVFYGAAGLVSVEMPGVTSIGANAFQNCNSLASVDLGSLETIKGYAFTGCTALGTVKLPASLDDLAASAREQIFSKCVNVTFEVTGTGRWSTAMGGKLLILDGTTLFSATSVSGAVTVPTGITTIYKYAFYGNTNITSVTIPSTVTDMTGRDIFNGCSNLASADLSAAQISTLGGTGVFQNCTSLVSVSLPNTLTASGTNAFSGCSKLSSINIPSGLTVIPIGFLSNCTSLVSVDLHSGITAINRMAFYYNTGLTTVIVRALTPPSLQYQSSTDAFTGTSSSLSIYVPNASEDAYKAAANWSTYASQIKPLSGLPE